MRTFVASFLACAALAVSAAAAATLPATPATIAAVLAKAQGGDVVVLGPGDYEALRLKPRKFDPALTVEATAARIQGAWYWTGIEGVTFKGGTWRTLRVDDGVRIRVEGGVFAGPADETGFRILRGRDIEVLGATFTGFKTGVALSQVSRFAIEDSGFDRMRSDGVQIGGSRNGRIVGNAFGGTLPIAGDHPDCIQLFNVAGAPPVADILIQDNDCTSSTTQGIAAFYHDDGGLDRISVVGNRVRVGSAHGITMQGVRDLVLIGNRVATWPGSKYQATIRTDGSGVIYRAGNRVAAGVGRPAVTDPE